MLFRLVIAVLVEELLEGLDGPGVQAAGPALRLADLGPGFLEGLVLEVVALQQFPLFFRELLDGGAHAAAHLLELDLLVSGQLLVGNLKAFSAFQAGGEDHRQAGHGAGDFAHVVVERRATATPVRQVGHVGVGAL